MNAGFGTDAGDWEDDVSFYSDEGGKLMLWRFTLVQEGQNKVDAVRLLGAYE